MKKVAYLVLAIILMSSIAQATDISIEKTLSKKVITENDTITVKITLTNNLNKEIKGELIDWCPGFARAEGYARKERHGGGTKPMPRWDITLKPSERREITYHINFGSIPTTLNDKNYTIQGARFQSDGDEYYSKSEDISVYITGLPVPERGCNYNFVCEPERGEHFGNCPQDCSSSGKDNYCNPVKNVVCDPDCGPGEDPDCEVEATTTITAAMPSTTLPAAITLPSEKPGGFGDYLLYIAVVFLIIILVLIFLSYMKIREEKRFLEEDRVEIGKQRLEIEKEHRMVEERWRQIEESESRWEKEQKRKLQEYKGGRETAWREWEQTQRKKLLEIEKIKKEVEKEREELRGERKRLRKDMETVEEKLAEIEELEKKWEKDIEEVEEDRNRLDEEWRELEKQKALLEEEIKRMEEQWNKIKNTEEELKQYREKIEEDKRIIEEEKRKIEEDSKKIMEDRRKVEEDYRKIEEMWLEIEREVKRKKR